MEALEMKDMLGLGKRSMGPSCIDGGMFLGSLCNQLIESLN